MATNGKKTEAAELAALYVSGALSDQEAREFEQRLKAGNVACITELRAMESVAAKLADTVLSSPPVGLRAKVLGRVASDATTGATPDPQVWKNWSPSGLQQDLFIQRAGQGSWEDTGLNGVQVQRLFIDPPRNQMTMLVRMEAGSSYPQHIHDGPEECYVLQGDLRVGDEVLGRGDYQRAAPGSRHGIQSTENGCLLFIVSSLTDKII